MRTALVLAAVTYSHTRLDHHPAILIVGVLAVLICFIGDISEIGRDV